MAVDSSHQQLEASLLIEASRTQTELFSEFLARQLQHDAVYLSQELSTPKTLPMYAIYSCVRRPLLNNSNITYQGLDISRPSVATGTVASARPMACFEIRTAREALTVRTLRARTEDAAPVRLPSST